MKYDKHKGYLFPLQSMRAVSCIVVIILFFNLFISCVRQEITSPIPEIPVGIFENIEYASTIEVKNPGIIHNEILGLICESHKPLSAKKLPTAQFVRLIVDSANEILEKHSLDIRISERDIAIILKGFLELKNNGGMDVFRPTRDGLLNSLNYAVETGYIDEQTSTQYLHAVLDVEKMEVSHEKRINFRSIVAVSTNEPMRDEMFMDVLEHSYRFWTDFEKNNPDIIFASTSTDSTEPDFDWDSLYEKIAGYGTDALYTISGIIMITVPVTAPIAILMLLASTTASIAMEIWMGDFLDWLDQF